MSPFTHHKINKGKKMLCFRIPLHNLKLPLSLGFTPILLHAINSPNHFPPQDVFFMTEPPNPLHQDSRILLIESRFPNPPPQIVGREIHFQLTRWEASLSDPPPQRKSQISFSTQEIKPAGALTLLILTYIYNIPDAPLSFIALIFC